MVGILKTELKRAIFNKKNIPIVILGILICLYSVFVRYHGVLFYDYGQSSADMSFVKQEIQNELNVFPVWFDGMDMYTLIMPLLACLPYATSFLMDRKTNFINMIYTRTKHKNYIICKVVANAISGGLVLVVPSLIFLCILYVFLSHEIIQFGVHPTGFMKSLFMSNPLLYIFFYSLIEFFFGSVYATFSMAVSVFTNNKIITLLTPFVYWFLGSFILESFGLISISPAMTNAFFVRTNSNIYLILGQLSVILVISISIILKHYGEE